MRKFQAQGLNICLVCVKRKKKHFAQIVVSRAPSDFSLEFTYLIHGCLTKGRDKGEKVFTKGSNKCFLLIFLIADNSKSTKSLLLGHNYWCFLYIFPNWGEYILVHFLMLMAHTLVRILVISVFQKIWWKNYEIFDNLIWWYEFL